MSAPVEETHAAFEADRRLAAGPLLAVALAVQARLAADPAAAVLIFDPDGKAVDLDLRGGPEALAARLTPATPSRGPGRPKLGVTAREVTLLPRHWDWLATQPGGASVALRRLVEAARREAEAPDRQRRGRDAAYRFLTALAGDRPGYEEACRALFAGDAAGFADRMADWPADVRNHALALAAG
ncbi:MAG: hypothetical protein JWP92_2279 [Caulobacter sp.]|nr:hypothetical protein [Caulobacter sp.]